MGLEKETNRLIVGGVKYVGRLGLDAAVVYGTLRIFTHLDHEHAMIAVENYSIIRYTVDNFDGIFWRQGRLHDYILKSADDWFNHFRKD